ncbi:hypothetical protein EYF80_055806 [Liparis tanakae]|uniref:Uncharacterized protein n=1 Tax=Liparis tanakae TaxID=230148 RepID=A0A4Z2EZT6_9TELE|nr:hypothetical protein EYF80_055806 [Liparis tanakae]
MEELGAIPAVPKAPSDAPTTVPLSYRHRTAQLQTPDRSATDTGPLSYRHRAAQLQTPGRSATDTGPSQQTQRNAT